MSKGERESAYHKGLFDAGMGIVWAVLFLISMLFLINWIFKSTTTVEVINPADNIECVKIVTASFAALACNWSDES